MHDDGSRILLQNVGKKFNLNLARKEGALFRLLDFLKKNSKHARGEFWALKNISMAPGRGKIIGIIGKNGSGKSTLLRTIAGIYQPDEGTLSIKGKIVFLAGFGHGLMPKLTMRDNIYLIGTLLGLKKKEIQERYGEIVEFSGLDKYQDAKVYQFSSGMISRLSFSTTIFCIKHENPDIILIDEALDAGADLDFRQKAMGKMEEIIKGNSNVIMVSHNLQIIENYCNEIFWMEKGEIIKQGSPAEIISEYNNSALWKKKV